MAATGANRTAFVQSLNHLIAMGLVERNPGYGHPLRPEFQLTQSGIVAAALATKIQTLPREKEQRDLLRRSWTLPILTSLNRPRQFNDIKRNLQVISDRALSQSLKSLEARDWVCRQIDVSARPPISIYNTVNTGRKISQIIAPKIRQTL
ncbi:MAG: winged helix-turn-helix transcriptional regulator [Cohaesibacter sp.]|nr:winged helix-turn-helix transcriptional regulator [Cohaesibacter sp.]